MPREEKKFDVEIYQPDGSWKAAHLSVVDIDDWFRFSDMPDRIHVAISFPFRVQEGASGPVEWAIKSRQLSNAEFQKGKF